MFLRRFQGADGSMAMGTRLASLLRHAGHVMLATTCMSCLVTQQYEERVEANVPPSYVPRLATVSGEGGTGTSTPGDQVLRLDLADPSVQTVEFDVVFREPNLRDNLEWRVFVDYDNTGTLPTGNIRLRARDGDIYPGPATQPERRIEISLPRSTFGPGCHRIEVLASGQFRRENPGTEADRSIRVPAVEGDLAQAVFWLMATDDANPTVDMGSCPQ